jgi:cytochrome c oxidase assembly protein subunit 15
LRPWAIIGLVLVFLQIILGAWTSTNYASLSCADFPLCFNDHAMAWQFRQAFHLLPVGINYDGGVLSDAARQTIQMMHRIGALIVSLYLFVLIAIGLHRLAFSNKNTQYLYLIAGLLIVQVCLGMMNVVFQLPLFTAVLHTVIAAALLLALITLVFRLGER